MVDCIKCFLKMEKEEDSDSVLIVFKTLKNIVDTF